MVRRTVLKKVDLLMVEYFMQNIKEQLKLLYQLMLELEEYIDKHHHL